MSPWLLAVAVVVAAAPVDSIGDDFERGDGPVGGGWLVGAPGGPGPVVAGGTVTQGEASNFWESLVWSEPLAGDAHWIEVDMVDAGQDLMLLLHHDGLTVDSPAETSGYALRWQPFDQRVTVLENGEYRGPHPTTGGPFSGPHTVRAEWDGVDQITVFVDGTQVMEWTDEAPMLGGPEQRRIGVMFPPVNAPVVIDAIRAGTLDEPATGAAEPPPTVPATAAPPATDPPTPATTTAETTATSESTAGTPAPPSTATTLVDNEFLPDRDLDDCISALPQPDCGSEGRSGWRQAAIFGLLVVALAFIAWRIVRSVRKGRSAAPPPPPPPPPSDDT